eukprot:446881-Karenia_brevis.AAC.1
MATPAVCLGDQSPKSCHGRGRPDIAYWRMENCRFLGKEPVRAPEAKPTLIDNLTTSLWAVDHLWPWWLEPQP